jgi:predicted TPR repeat methyltransferase
MNYICKCYKENFFDKDYSYWEDREVTSDELDIMNFISSFKTQKFKSILHIGIGNSSLCKKINNNCNITGITISKKEINKANTLNLPNYMVYLCDKYSIEFNSLIKKKKFDLIIDTNLKSYSCCQESFEFMMKNIIESINNDGMLITSINGMKWYKKLKPKLSFSFRKLFYFKLKEINGNELNILTTNELRNLSQKFNLKMSFDDKLCYLKK